MTDQEIADKVSTRRDALLSAMAEAYNAGILIEVVTVTHVYADGIERTHFDLNMSRPIY